MLDIYKPYYYVSNYLIIPCKIDRILFSLGELYHDKIKECNLESSPCYQQVLNETMEWDGRKLSIFSVDQNTFKKQEFRDHIQFIKTIGYIEFYDVDEPVGRSLCEDDLYPSKKEAKESLKDFLKNNKKYLTECIELYEENTLENWRARKIEWIKSTFPEEEKAKDFPYIYKSKTNWFKFPISSLRKWLLQNESKAEKSPNVELV